MSANIGQMAIRFQRREQSYGRGKKGSTQSLGRVEFGFPSIFGQTKFVALVLADTKPYKLQVPKYKPTKQIMATLTAATRKFWDDPEVAGIDIDDLTAGKARKFVSTSDSEETDGSLVSFEEVM